MSAIPCASVNLKTMADGTLRISFDIEPMHAQDAFRLFAAPGTPAAIAALQVGYAQVKEVTEVSSQESKSQKPKGGALSKLAGMWSNDQEFFKWLIPVYDAYLGDVGHDVFDKPSDYCKHCILVMCEIDSRAELDHNPDAAEKFNSLIRGPFSRHLIARGITI